MLVSYGHTRGAFIEFVVAVVGAQRYASRTLLYTP
jgi:hypothetical protein